MRVNVRAQPQVLILVIHFVRAESFVPDVRTGLTAQPMSSWPVPVSITYLGSGAENYRQVLLLPALVSSADGRAAPHSPVQVLYPLNYLAYREPVLNDTSSCRLGW